MCSRISSTSSRADIRSPSWPMSTPKWHGMHDRRARDPHVDLAGPGIPHQLHQRPGGGAPHQRVVDHHHALAAQVLAEGVELQRDPALADLLRRLDERAADVAVLDQPVVERHAALAGVADGRRDRGVGHRDHDVGRPPATPAPARGRAPRGRRARCGRPTWSRAGRSRRTRTCSEPGGWPGRAAGGGAPRCPGATPARRRRSRRSPSSRASASAHVSLATACPPLGSRPSDSGRKPHGSRTASTRSPVSRTSENAPFHAGSVRSIRSSHVLPPAAASISVITSESLDAGEPEATGEQLLAQRRRVHDVAVVGERQRAVHRLDEERLDVALVVPAGGGVAGVADRVVADERSQRLAGEHVRHQAGLLVHPHPAPVAHRHAGGFLAAVLQREQPEERDLRHAVTGWGRQAEDAALLARGIVGRTLARRGRDRHGHGVGLLESVMRSPYCRAEVFAR